jgi:ABC-2 type transport system ATP-binding protein
MIEVQHLTKRYGSVTAVDDVSFRVDAGEILGFLGPNGAGKTTTMRMITGYMPPTEGQAVVAGHDVFAQPLEAKRKIGYLPETPPLYPEMTVREYLTFAARLKLGKVTGADVATRVAHTMKKARVDDMADRACGKLSKGYKQRVGLAQALIHDPEVLILDEPTAGLDPKQIMETRDLVKGLAGSHTIVLSTHILPEVAQTCTRVVIINKGRVVAVDSTENLTHQLKGAASLYVQVEGPEEAASALGSVPGVRKVSPFDRHERWIGFEVEAEKDHDVRRAVAQAIVSKGWGLLELRPTRVSLEEIFLQLTTEEAAQMNADAAPAESTGGEAANG